MAKEKKKGIGSINLPTIPWAKLSKLTRVHKILITVGVLGALWGCFVWFPQNGIPINLLTGK